MFNKRTAEDWMRRQVYDRKGDRATKFVLKHISAGSKMGAEVSSMDVPESIEDTFFKACLAEFESAATADANGVGGIQSYAIQAFCADSDKPMARLSFKIQAEDMDGEEGFASEPPTKSGIVSQLMRHNEAIMRTSTASVGHLMGLLQKTLDRVSQVNEKLIAEKFDNMDTIQGLLMQKDDREMARKQQESEIASRQAVVERVLQLAPVVVNKLAGKPLLPAKSSASDLMVKSLMESITPEQIGKLQGILTPEQQITVYELMQQSQGSETPKQENGTDNDDRKVN